MSLMIVISEQPRCEIYFVYICALNCTFSLNPCINTVAALSVLFSDRQLALGYERQ
jgi:hypothetical protein